jgi:hypothetical protein
LLNFRRTVHKLAKLTFYAGSLIVHDVSSGYSQFGDFLLSKGHVCSPKPSQLGEQTSLWSGNGVLRARQAGREVGNVEPLVGEREALLPSTNGTEVSDLILRYTRHQHLLSHRSFATSGSSERAQTNGIIARHRF